MKRTFRQDGPKSSMSVGLILNVVCRAKLGSIRMTAAVELKLDRYMSLLGNVDYRAGVRTNSEDHLIRRRREGRYLIESVSEKGSVSLTRRREGRTIWTIIVAEERRREDVERRKLRHRGQPVLFHRRPFDPKFVRRRIDGQRIVVEDVSFYFWSCHDFVHQRIDDECVAAAHPDRVPAAGARHDVTGKAMVADPVVHARSSRDIAFDRVRGQIDDRESVGVRKRRNKRVTVADDGDVVYLIG